MGQLWLKQQCYSQLKHFWETIQLAVTLVGLNKAPMPKFELLMRFKSGSKACRFSYIFVDVDLRTNQCVDCRPDGLNQCYLHFGGTLPNPPPLQSQDSPKIFWLNQELLGLTRKFLFWTVSEGIFFRPCPSRKFALQLYFIKK